MNETPNLDNLELSILAYTVSNTNIDAEDIAKRFAIPLFEAIDITERLIKLKLIKIKEDK